MYNYVQSGVQVNSTSTWTWPASDRVLKVTTRILPESTQRSQTRTWTRSTPPAHSNASQIANTRYSVKLPPLSKQVIMCWHVSCYKVVKSAHSSLLTNTQSTFTHGFHKQGSTHILRPKIPYTSCSVCGNQQLEQGVAIWKIILSHQKQFLMIWRYRYLKLKQESGKSTYALQKVVSKLCSRSLEIISSWLKKKRSSLVLLAFSVNVQLISAWWTASSSGGHEKRHWAKCKHKGYFF